MVIRVLTIILAIRVDFFGFFFFFVTFALSTNNLYIMKKSRVFNSNLLITQRYCHLLREWLCRHDLYYKFVENLSRSVKREGSIDRFFFDYILCLTQNPCLSIGDAITAAFPFVETPEGYIFWMRVSKDWIAFCKVSLIK